MDAAIRLAHAYPNWLTFVLVPGLLCLAAIAAPVVRSGVTGRDPSEKTHTAAIDAIKAVATFLVFILAVSLNQVMGHARQAEEMVQREASLVTQMDRNLLRIGVPALAEQRPVLAEYLRSVSSEEWDAMARGARHQRSYDLLSSIQRAVRTTEVETPRQQALYAELLRVMEQLSDAREARLAASQMALPGLFWSALLIGSLLMLPLCALTEATLSSALVKGAILGSVGLLIALVMVIDRPFSGETRVSPAALERALERNLVRR